MNCAVQNVSGFTPETNCKCLAFETRSSTKKRTKEAGTKLIEKMRVMANATLIPTCNLRNVKKKEKNVCSIITWCMIDY